MVKRKINERDIAQLKGVLLEHGDESMFDDLCDDCRTLKVLEWRAICRDAAWDNLGDIVNELVLKFLDNVIAIQKEHIAMLKREVANGAG